MKTLEIQQTNPFKHPSKHDAQELQYRLLSATGKQGTRYEISVTYGNEHAVAVLPFSTRSEAVAAYERIKQGLVTPVTLSDIVEDMNN